jgi:hypothetical protein
MISASECLTALLIGLHYEKSRFSIANFFNEILDSVADLQNFQPTLIRPHELGFKVGKIKATLTHEAFIINSHLSIGTELLACLPKRDDKFIAVPATVYDDKFEIQKEIEILKESPKNFRRNFIEECIEIIRLVDKIVQGGLSPLRFIGLVEYYAVPLDVVNWDILERFTKEAEIPGATNTEKIALNRYYFPASQEKDERCLLFKLVKPDDHKVNDPRVGGASFDFQFIPEKPKMIAEFGGPKEMVTSLATGIQEIIDHSKFMNFSPRK